MLALESMKDGASSLDARIEKMKSQNIGLYTNPTNARIQEYGAFAKEPFYVQSNSFTKR